MILKSFNVFEAVKRILPPSSCSAIIGRKSENGINSSHID